MLCEKPLAPTVEEGRQIVDAQAERGLGDLVSVGFMRRFHPGFTAMKAALASGELGAPLMVLGSHRNVRAYPTGGSEGTLTNSAVHDIDITEWLLESPIVEVGWYAPKSTSLDPDRQDPQLIHLRTADGVLASIDLFVNARYGYDVRYELVGERGACTPVTDSAHRDRPRSGPRLRPPRRLASLLRRRLPARAPGVGRLGRPEVRPPHWRPPRRVAVHGGGPAPSSGRCTRANESWSTPLSVPDPKGVNP